MGRYTLNFNFVYPPIPLRCFDWSATRDTYDEGSLVGQGATKIDALIDLLMQEDENVDQYGWMIEGPSTHYLAARKLGKYEFYWTMDPHKGLRFYNQEQADATMMTIRELCPDLFPAVFGEAKPVEHAWVELKE